MKRAAIRFLSTASHEDKQDFDEFCAGNVNWLPDFALFMACKQEQGGVAWNQWPVELARREPTALDAARERLKQEMLAIQFWQFEFFRQWQELRAYAHRSGNSGGRGHSDLRRS